MIDNKFLYFQTHDAFDEQLNGGNISQGSIAFIEDTSTIWTHGKEYDASGGEDNVIEQIKVNNTAITPDANRSVNITVPTQLSDLTSDSTHRVVTDAEKASWDAKADADDFEGVVYVGDAMAEGDDPTASFNAYSDTVWNKQQSLSDTQKQQILDNISAYSKDQVDEILATLEGGTAKVVSSLPTASADTQGDIYYVTSSLGNSLVGYVTVKSGSNYSWANVVNYNFSNVGNGYAYKGVAMISTNPDTVTSNIFYILGEAGTYPNMGSVVHTSGIGIALWDGTAWSYQNVPMAAFMGDIYAEMYGEESTATLVSVQTDTKRYPSVHYNGAMVTTSQSFAINNYPIVAGKRYEISIPKAPNNAAYSIVYRTNLASYDRANNIQAITDTVGTNAAMSYTIASAENFPYLSVCYVVANGEPTITTTVNNAPVVVKTTEETFTESAKAQARENIDAANVSVEQDMEAIKEDLYYTEDKVVNWVDNLMAQQTNFRTREGKRTTLPILLYEGETATITTASDGSYIMYPIVQVSGANATIANSYPCTGLVVRTGSSSTIVTYNYTATADIWICLSGTSDCTYSFSNLKEKSTIEKLENEVAIIDPIFKNSRIMFFGASNTAQSTTGVVGFAQLIAESSGLPYRPFLYDSADGNTADVIDTNPNVTNYAKDGTCLRVISGRTDGVVARIKRHITESDYPDYVVIGFPANDAASQYTNMGTMSDSYTATFDTDTQLGALEEVCRYITELGKPIKFGCFIPWEITWVASNFYDAYIPVLQKWGVPYLDLRRTAGFDIKNCAAHRNLYSLTADDYANWSASTTYNLDDKVKYGGSLYKCNADGVVGIEPTNTTYWMLVSSTSADGTHLNSIGSKIVMGKIRAFIESL